MGVTKHEHSAKGTALDKAVAAEDFLKSQSQKYVHGVLHSPLFEHGMSVIILANFVMIIMETDIIASDEEVPSYMDVASWIVLSTFVVELLARIHTQGRNFWYDYFNDFDFLIVFIDGLFSLLAVAFGSMFPVSVLRVFRLCKVVRVSKIFRVFPELRLMMAGLLGALRAIFWGAILLALSLIVWGIIAVQFINPLNQELQKIGIYDDCERCGRSYSDVMTAVLTFCQQIVAGDSWGMVTIPLIEHYPISAVFFAAVFMTVGMAVLNLMLAVCVDVATQARASLKTEMDQEKLLTEQELTTQLIRTCRDMDTDASGELTKEELVNGYDNNKDFQNTLLELEIGREDLEIVWLVLDSDKSGLVSYTEFIAQLLGMKTSDTQFMLAYIKYYITVIREKMSSQMEQLHDDIQTEIRMQRENQQTQAVIVEEENKKMDTILSKFDDKQNSVAIMALAGSAAGPTVAGGTPPTVIPPTGVFQSPMLIQERKSETTQVLGTAKDMQVFESLVVESRACQAELMSMVKGIAEHLRIRPQPAAAQREQTEPVYSESSLLWPLPASCQRACTGQKQRPIQTDSLLTVPGQSSGSGAFGTR